MVYLLNISAKTFVIVSGVFADTNLLIKYLSFGCGSIRYFAGTNLLVCVPQK